MEGNMLKKGTSGIYVLFIAAFLFVVAASPALADKYTDAAKKWVESEFQPSTLNKEQQIKEMAWFIKAAEPYKGMEIKVVSETIATHDYESKTLAKAFFEMGDNQFYFSQFDGKQNCLLHSFFLAAYKIQKGFYKDMVITDEYFAFIDRI